MATQNLSPHFYTWTASIVYFSWRLLLVHWKCWERIAIPLIHIAIDWAVLGSKWWLRHAIFICPCWHQIFALAAKRATAQNIYSPTVWLLLFLNSFFPPFFAMQIFSQLLLIKLTWRLLNSEKWYFTTIYNSFIFWTQWIYLCLDWAILLIIHGSGQN